MDVTNQNTENKNIYKPYKVIYRYRNNNRKIQYCYYIFLGNIPNAIKRIITKINDSTFIQALLQLSPDEINILEDFYNIY